MKLRRSKKFKKDFKDNSLSNLWHTTLISEAISDNHAANKSSVDSLSENDRSKPDLSVVFNYQDNEFDNNIISNLDSVALNRAPTSGEELPKENMWMIILIRVWLLDLNRHYKTISKYPLDL